MSTENNNPYLHIAHSIGVDLCRRATWNTDSCNWVDVDYDFVKQTYSFHPMNYTFYEGTSSVAFFLLNLFSLTGENIFKKTAIGALQAGWNNCLKDANTNVVSFYSGKSGLAYSMLRAYTVTGDKEWYKKSTSKVLWR